MGKTIVGIYWTIQLPVLEGLGHPRFGAGVRHQDFFDHLFTIVCRQALSFPSSVLFGPSILLGCASPCVDGGARFSRSLFSFVSRSSHLNQLR